MKVRSYLRSLFTRIGDLLIALGLGWFLFATRRP
jgi:hypothetical protein